MRSKNLFLCLLVAAFTLTPVREVYSAVPQLTAGNGDGSILIKYDDDTTSVASGDKTIAIGQQVTANGLNSIAIGDNVTANQGIAIGYEGTTSTGNRAVAIGNHVTANGDDSIAIGSNVTANKGIAIGYGNTTATSSEAIAIGSYAQANRGIAIGRMAKAENQHSLALGFDATAKENQSTAVGAYTEAQNEKATAIGYYAHAMGENTTALGGMTYAYEADNIAIGTNVEAGSEYSRDKNIVAVGVGLDVEGGESTVVGSNSADYKKYYTRDGVSGFGYDVTLGSNYSSAFGHRASVNSGADYAVALGSGSQATEAYTVSIGSSTTQRRLVNLAAGKADTDAVNVSQLNDLNTLLGGSTLTGGKWGEKFSVDGTEYDSVADAISSLAGGSDNSVLYDGDDKSTVTLGGTNGTKITNLAAGVNASDAVNFGQLSSLGDKIASTLGGDFKFKNGTLTGGITYGDETTIQGAFNSIRDELEKLSEGWTFNPVDDSQQSGGEGTGNGAGTPPASSTIKPGDSLTVNAGDDINITQNGDKDYTISVDPTLREEIEEGYTAADDALKTEITEAYKDADKKLEASITEAYQQADSELKAGIDKNAATIGEIGSVLGGAENGYKKPAFDTVTANDINVGKINISGSGINMGGADINTGGGNIDMGGGRITNVANGAVAQNSTDAVNGGQLWDAYQRMDGMGNDIYRRMDDLREDVNIVGAHAAALSGLHPIDYNPYEPTTLSAAIGTYRDEYAVAVGVFHYAKENVMFNLGASLCSDGDVMGRAGVSFTVGKSSDKPKVAGTMNGLRNQVIAMQAKLDELEEQNARNEDIIRQNMELIRELKAELDAKR